MQHAVFPGGSRIRPTFCVVVAAACGDAAPRLTDAAAAAVELLHCASLVYDDLPCFDNAPLRRGASAVHAAHGEELAVLVGTALTVLAFEFVAKTADGRAQQLPDLIQRIAGGVGCPAGIAAGQAHESEATVVDLAAYHRAKTGALFEAAITAGALTGGGDWRRWEGLGHCLGEAYQIADDLRDAHGDAAHLGKPVGQDTRHARPSATISLGVGGSLRRLSALLTDACDRVPECPGRDDARALIRRLELQLSLHTRSAGASVPDPASTRAVR